MLVIGHGSGSFGHVAASRVGMTGGGAGGDQSVVDADSATTVQHAAMTLHRIVVDAFHRAGAAPFSLPPSSWMVAENGEPVTANVEPIVRALALGAVPVVCGDVVLDRALGATICSTETVFRMLIDTLPRRQLSVARMYWLGETGGIYDPTGATIESVDGASFERVRGMIGGTDGTDVTGGMLLRLETARGLAKRGIESWIVDGTIPGLLAAALGGDHVPGTRVVADPVAGHDPGATDRLTNPG